MEESMSLTSKEAAETLSDVERASRRSAQAFGYRKASPHLILWGAIWVVGYTGTDLWPVYSDWIWGLLVLAGCVGGLLIGRHTAAGNTGPYAWRMFALIGIILVFISATYSIMRPTYGSQLAAFPALLTGTVYMAVGLWFGLRYVVAGLLVIALTLGGFFFLHEHMMLWMAFVGGSAMMLAGLWFRQV
jgi:hypothetical protein